MLAPNCHIVNPSALDAAEREYRNTIAQQGWCNLWSPLDENGLGVPPPKKNWMGVMNDKKGKDLDDLNADGDLDGDGVRKSIFLSCFSVFSNVPLWSSLRLIGNYSSL